MVVPMKIFKMKTKHLKCKNLKNFTDINISNNNKKMPYEK